MPKLIADFRQAPFDDDAVAVPLLFNEDRDLVQLTRLHCSRELADELQLWEEKLRAHLRSGKEGGLDSSLSLSDFVPQDVLDSLQAAQAKALDGLYSWVRLERPSELERYWSETVPRSRTLVSIESNRIHVDMASLERLISSGAGTPSERSFLEGVLTLLDEDGFVSTKFNLRPAKTGRLRIERGLACMSIPHGICRTIFTSRFDGGQIVSFDFNAIDYRSIVHSIGGEFAKLYSGATDFHTRTAELIGAGQLSPEGRAQVKYTSYIHFYGGKPETVSSKTGIAPSVVRSVLRVMDDKLAPITEFKKRIAREARERGYVEVLDEHRVPVSLGDSDGKILGLYAQTYSSRVFDRAMIRVQEQVFGSAASKLLFPVHDELDVDMAPNELHLVPKVVEQLQAEGFIVKVKIGENYDAATK